MRSLVVSMFAFMALAMCVGVGSGTARAMPPPGGDCLVEPSTTQAVEGDGGGSPSDVCITYHSRRVCGCPLPGEPAPMCDYTCVTCGGDVEVCA